MAHNCGKNHAGGNVKEDSIGSTEESAERAAKLLARRGAQDRIDTFTADDCPAKCSVKQFMGSHSTKKVTSKQTQTNPEEWIAEAEVYWKASVYCLTPEQADKVEKYMGEVL
jgi:hypothetical protein